MARMTVNGFELIEGQLNRMGRPMIRKVLEAGAKAAETRMAANAAKARHSRSGEMIRSIGNNGIREYMGGASTEVYPQGDDPKTGARNATKAYVTNYGKGQRPVTRRGARNRTGDKFITGDESKAEEAIAAAMQAESDRLIAELE